MNISGYLKKLKNIEIIIFFFSILLFYYFVPIIIILSNSQSTFFSSQTNVSFFNNNLIFFSRGFSILIIINLFIFFFIFFFILKNISQKIIENKNYKIVKENFFYKIILYLLCLIVIFDIVQIFKNLLQFIQLKQHYIEVGNINSFFKEYRENIKEIIFQKRTHYKILMILSVYFFRFDKKLSIICYLLIIFANFLTLSRFEILQLLILHTMFNVRLIKINKNYLLYAVLFIFFLLFYRFILFLFNSGDFVYIFRHLLGDGNSVFLINFVFYENLKDTIPLFNEYFFDLIFIYFKNTLFYLLSDFFKLDVSTIDFFSHNKFNNFTFAISPVAELIMYPFIFLFYICILYYMRIHSFLRNKLLFNLILLTISIYCIRGSLLHELGFLVKFLILIKIIEFVANIILGNEYFKKLYKKIIINF